MIFSIEEIAGALSEATGLNLSVYNSISETISQYAETDIDLSLLFNYSRMKKIVKDKNRFYNRPEVIFNEINCGWIGLYWEPDDKLYVVGPVLLGGVSDKTVISHYLQNGLYVREGNLLVAEYHKIPIVPFATLLQHYNFIHRLLTGTTFDLSELGTDRGNTKQVIVNRNEEEVYQLQQRNFEISLKSEEYMLDCVRNGDIERLKIKDAGALKELTSLASSEIRSLKNNLIIAIGSITRAAMKGGLVVEIAYQLSDRYIFQLESMTDITTVIEVYQQAVRDFTLSVKNNQFKVEYSRVINKCCRYIAQNYSIPLKLSDIAIVMDLSPDYLSRRFKKETGVSIIQYIRMTKVKEARMLIRYSGKSMTDISFCLGYPNQGTFIKDFKREEGMTPSKYRDSQI